jgi:putative hemolysin
MSRPASSPVRAFPDPFPGGFPSGSVPDFHEVNGRYRVRFARSGADIAAACRLRFEVFNLEFGEGLASAHELGEDRDIHDDHCQHLIVEYLPDGTGSLGFGGGPASAMPRVVGTYRLQTAATAESSGTGFYSSGIFDLATLPTDMLEDAVELGRACVHRAHRNRRTLFMLWRGLAAYVMWHRKRWFFGCNSLSTESHREGRRMMAYLVRHGHVHPDLQVDPHEHQLCRATASAHPDDDLPMRIPSLFGTYLRYGAKVCGPPAHDRRFHTIDFFTVVDLQEMETRTFQNFASRRQATCQGSSGS